MGYEPKMECNVGLLRKGHWGGTAGWAQRPGSHPASHWHDKGETAWQQPDLLTMCQPSWNSTHLREGTPTGWKVWRWCMVKSPAQSPIPIMCGKEGRGKACSVHRSSRANKTPANLSAAEHTEPIQLKGVETITAAVCPSKSAVFNVVYGNLTTRGQIQGSEGSWTTHTSIPNQYQRKKGIFGTLNETQRGILRLHPWLLLQKRGGRVGL